MNSQRGACLAGVIKGRLSKLKARVCGPSGDDARQRLGDLGWSGSPRPPWPPCHTQPRRDSASDGSSSHNGNEREHVGCLQSKSCCFKRFSAQSSRYNPGGENLNDSETQPKALAPTRSGIHGGGVPAIPCMPRGMALQDGIPGHVVGRSGVLLGPLAAPYPALLVG